MKSHIISVALALVVPLAACSRNSPVASNTTESPTAQSSPSSEATQTSVTKDWYTYTAQDSSYTVKFPKKPLEDNRTVANQNLGKLNYLQVLYEDKANQRAFLTANIKYPGKSSQYNFAKDRIKTELDAIRDGQAQGSNSTISSEKEITYEGLTGREITFKGKKGETMRSRILIDAKQPALYQMLVVAANGNIDFPEAQAFLDSLAISK